MSVNTFLDADNSRRYDRRAGRLFGRIYDRIAADTDPGPRARVLDIGTGPGHLLARLAARRPDLRLAGVDLAPPMIELAAGHLAGAPVELSVGDVAALPYPDDSFDYLISTISLHEWPDIDSAAGELARVLAPGGRVVIYDYRFVRTDRAQAALRAAFGADPVRTAWGPLGLFARITVGA
ncbi:ubiquinone/menaquinone biosynthesis C-methylase UbiE [Nocardia transvalensis]|uniref:Ubiquinone/menaquinone biosynthesis C-methylase UbiE n=1 Tax=Nocardia transvalensis TaxID=37333 RepID=A0A7W9UJ59_9NOCA|nr:class I SAM-dependent methyltransferase [Nocardia transvalensis]MBB5915001.1 ubiquinone/menaquinone biosynthesis C-methylase UbiE [Nocardia transvalensis]